MRAVVQRVSQASVDIAGECVAQIARGLLILLGVEKGDGQQDAAYLADKLLNLRIFEDDGGKMNLSVQDVDGELLIVSQFTLLADCRKGRRPAFDQAAPPEEAARLYEYFAQLCSTARPAQTGRFAAHMRVSLINDGPVTIVLDSRKTTDSQRAYS